MRSAHLWALPNLLQEPTLLLRQNKYEEDNDYYAAYGSFNSNICSVKG